LVSRKYIKDYERRTVTGPNGRKKTEFVYQGDWYTFLEKEETVQRVKKRYYLLTLLCVALYLAVMFMNAPCSHVNYVIMPFAIIAFPLYFVIKGCLRLHSARGKINREHRDKIENRLSLWLGLMLIFSGASVIAHIACFVLNGAVFLDVLNLAFTLAILVSTHVMLRSLRHLDFKKV